MLYTVLSWPICYVTKPSYRYYNSINTYMGGTKYISSWGYTIVLWSGFLISLSRLRDRLILTRLKQLLRIISFQDAKEIQEQNATASLNTFLATSLNTELVVTILKGILIQTSGMSDLVDNMNEDEMLKVRTETNIEIDTIKILNAKKWEVGLKGVDALAGTENELMEEIVLGTTEDKPRDTGGTIFGLNLSSSFNNSSDLGRTTMMQENREGADVNTLSGAKITAYEPAIF